MNTLFFTHQHRRSTKTLRLDYGLEGMKYIIQVYEGEINGHGEKEGLPKISKDLSGDMEEGINKEHLRQFRKSEYPFSHEHPLLHSPTSKIHQDTQTPLWSRGYEIHHSGV